MFDTNQQPVSSKRVATGEIVTRRVVNISGAELTVKIAESLGAARTYTFPPGRFVELPAAYTLPQTIAAGREPRPSVISQLTNGMVLDESDPRAKEAVEQAIAAEKKYRAAMAEVDRTVNGKGGR